MCVCTSVPSLSWGQYRHTRCLQTCFYIDTDTLFAFHRARACARAPQSESRAPIHLPVCPRTFRAPTFFVLTVRVVGFCFCACDEKLNGGLKTSGIACSTSLSKYEQCAWAAATRSCVCWSATVQPRECSRIVLPMVSASDRFQINTQHGIVPGRPCRSDKTCLFVVAHYTKHLATQWNATGQ